MAFAHPEQWLWLAALGAVLVLALRRRWAQKRTLLALFDREGIEKVFPYSRWRSWTLRQGLLQAAAFLFLLAGLAGPEIGQKLEEVKTRSGTVFLLFDCSDSMLAEDLKPNRMESAKLLFSGLLERMRGQRVGIIAFAGEAFVFCPLTSDVPTAKRFLKSVQAGMVPQPGTRIGAALRLALAKLPEGQAGQSILLLTDGEDHKSDPMEAVEEARRRGVKIFAIGIGNPEGEPIPVRDASGNVAGYKRDRKGDVVLSRMDEPALSRMAARAGGAYFRATQSGQEIDAVLQGLEELEKAPLAQKRRRYEDRYQWFVLLSLLLFLAGEAMDPLLARRLRPLAALLLTAGTLALAPDRLDAESFRGEIRRGNRDYREKKFGQALQRYRKAETLRPQDPRAKFNRGAALYRLEDWEKSAEAFAQSSQSKDRKVRKSALYNLGNSRFRNGQYGEAAEAYRQSLKIDPNDPDARYNLKLALRFQKNPPPQESKTRAEEKNDKQKSGEGSDGERREREENAKRALKSASGDEGGRPVFKPGAKDQPRKRGEEDW